ncbi:MAG: pseudaminic acid synthase [Bryobacteraceae bacterium]
MESAVPLPFVTIAGRRVGPGYPVYVVAEISANHNRDFEQAVKLIEAASQAGADAVKLQTYTPDTMTLHSERDCFRIGGGTLWDGKTLYDLYGEACTPWEWHPKLKEVANRRGLHLFSTAFDSTSLDFLESLGMPAHKVASFEIVDIPLIRQMARTGKPLIVSTGMATLEEIDEAVSAARHAGARQIALLQCTSAYPAPPSGMHLRTIPDLLRRFGVPVGLSDHTLGTAVPVAAVALGACIVEKHVTLSRSTPGPDSQFSLEPHELKDMLHAIRTTEEALGSIHYGASEAEASSRAFRRSLFVVQDVAAGEAFGPKNVRSIRPSHGLHPRFLDAVMGRRAARDVELGTPLRWDMVGSSECGRLAGERVYLRPMNEGDTDSVVRWRSDPSVSCQLFALRSPTAAEHESFLADMQKRGDRREFIIVLCHEDRPVGQIGLSRIDSASGEAEYGILIGESECRGTDAAREASHLVLGYAFEKLGLRRIVLRLFADNLPAVRLYRRLGFNQIPESAGEQLKDGVLRPTIAMCLDRQDWEKRT